MSEFTPLSNSYIISELRTSFAETLLMSGSTALLLGCASQKWFLNDGVKLPHKPKGINGCHSVHLKNFPRVNLGCCQSHMPRLHEQEPETIDVVVGGLSALAVLLLLKAHPAIPCVATPL